jgi:heme exporter protein A
LSGYFQRNFAKKTSKHLDSCVFCFAMQQVFTRFYQHHPFISAPGPLRLAGVKYRRAQYLLGYDLSFTCLPSQVVWLAGANGSGKTSLLRLIAGFTQPVHGSMFWQEAPFTPRQRLISSLLWGYKEALKAELTVTQMLNYWACLWQSGLDLAWQARLLTKIDLERQAHMSIHTLSSGQRRRLALVRLILARRPLWLLDEPNVALDTLGLGILHELISAHCQAGGLVIAASHQTPSWPAHARLQLLGRGDGLMPQYSFERISEYFPLHG